MHTPETRHSEYPILVVSYDEKSRKSLTASVLPYDVPVAACSTFCEAEDLALQGLYRGILVDLATMIKAKSEEKIVAYTLAGFYPTLRVKTVGTMLIPMSMAGETKQDKNLNDFITKTCAQFTPRRLRAFKRKDVSLSTTINMERGFTLNVSWSGMFVADMYPEKYSIGDELTVTLPEFDKHIEVVVARTQSWGQRRPAGIGVKYKFLSQDMECSLFSVLRSDKNKERDRIIA